MVAECLLAHVARHVRLDPAEQVLLTDALLARSVRRGETVLNQGETCSKFFFVESGSFRAFHLNPEGKDATVMFALADWWITDMDAFAHQVPSSLTIAALEESAVWALDFGRMQSLLEAVPKLERYFRILYQHAYIREQRRALLNLSQSTARRYESFLRQFPQISRKVTQKQIASYLGVTPEFLSAVKKKPGLKKS